MYTVLERNDGDLVVESPRGFLRIPEGRLVSEVFYRDDLEVVSDLNGFYKAVGAVERNRVWPGYHGRDWAASIRGLQAFGLSRAASCDDPANVGRYETTLPEGVEVVAHEIADVTLGARVIHQIAYQRFGILPATLD